MGQQVAARTFNREDRQRYRRKIRLCLDVFARMLSEARFHPERRSFGLEIELNLTDDAGEPAMANAPLLPVCDEEDPLESLERGDVPRLAELRLHNGTIYRWNRPIHDVVRGQPHLRVENRVLPAGPTVVDILANAAFYYGLVRVLAEDERPVWSQMSFSAAEENFHAGARDGIEARMYWPGLGELAVAELVLRRLLPLAHNGLQRWRIDPADRDRLLGIIERRCVVLRNGASWQSDVFHRLYEDRGMDRPAALREMTARYREHMHSNVPVHEWPTD